MYDQLHPQPKRIRLDPAVYSETGAICSITLCVADRVPLFSDTALADACTALLRSRADVSGVAVHAYCLMPDHLHLLISPSAQASILDFLRDFKGLSTRLAWQRGHQGKTWQQSFYDHFLRKDEDVQVVVSYILNNPVRKGMVEEWHQYPYCGSLVYKL